MKKLLMILTISVIASIMIISGIIASPDAYSDKNHDEVSDECSCEKPDTLKVQFNAPVDGPFKIEIYKKLDDRNDPEKLPLMTFENVPKIHVEGESLVISAILFGKDKLESNTAFVVYETDDTTPVALMEIHTSCSKPLYKGLEVNNNEYSLIVEDGLSMGTTSIPEFEPLTCEDKKLKSTASITIKKAITNDNDGTATAADFEITITNVDTTEKIIIIHDEVDPDDSLINVNNVQAGTYTISETPPTNKGTYTTVLIAGDTGCPSMVGEEFTIKKNKHLSCTIYDDDNGDGSTDGLSDFIFQKASLQIDLADPTGNHSCNAVPMPSPCIQIIDDDIISIVDPKLKSTSTIVLFSVFGETTIDSIFNPEPSCTLSRLLTHNVMPNAPTDAGTTLGVVLECPGFDIPRVYNVNYVMINPLS